MDNLTAIPALRSQFRFQWEVAQDCHVLLYPEGMVRLNDSAGEIIACCDGSRTVAQIINLLEEKFPEAHNLRADTVEFFETAHENQWIEFN